MKDIYYFYHNPCNPWYIKFYVCRFHYIIYIYETYLFSKFQLLTVVVVIVQLYFREYFYHKYVPFSILSEACALFSSLTLEIRTVIFDRFDFLI